MFDGFLQLGGTEIANTARTQAYVRNNMPAFPLRDCVDCDGLQAALGDANYESPLVDDAPWMDHSDPSSMGFYGFLPMEIQGMDDSTVTAGITESVNAGGSIGRSRASTRQIRVRGVLIGHDDRAVTTGMAWLQSALSSSDCGGHNGGSCGGAGLCFYNACPEIIQCFEDDYTRMVSESIGTVTEVTSPAIFQLPQIAAMFRTEFKFPARDSMLVRWGAMSENSQEVLEEHGEIVSSRLNVITNPSFYASTTGWSSNVGGTLTRQAAGGVEGGAYGRIIATEAATTLRTSNLSAAFGSNTASFHLRSTGAETVVARLHASSDGTVLAAFTANVTTDWERFSFSSGFGRSVYLSFEVAGDGRFDIDRVLLEAGTMLLPYFDGRSNPSVMDDYRSRQLPVEYKIVWAGVADASASRMTWLGKYEEEWCESRWRPFIAARNVAIESGTIDYWYREEIPASVQAEPFERYMHNVSMAVGPKVIRKHNPSVGAMTEIDFTIVAALPFVFSSERFIAAPNPADADPWTDVACVEESLDPIIDPDCPPMAAAPRPPAIDNPCIDDPNVWKRSWVDVPATEVSTWADMVPTVVLNTRAGATRQVRVRVFPNPFGYPVVNSFVRNIVTNPSMEAAGGLIDVRQNLATDPNGTVVGGGGTTGVTLGWDPTRWFGTAPANGTYTASSGVGPVGGANTYVRKTWTTAPATMADTGDTGINNGRVNVVAGQTYTFSSYLRPSVARNIRIGLMQRNAASAVSAGAVYGATVFAPANVWTRISLTYTVPAANVAMVDVNSDTIASADGGAAKWVVGSTLDGTGLLFENVPLLAPLIWGGKAAAGGFVYAWAAAANASRSFQRATGPANIPGGGQAAIIQSSAWASQGSKSAEIIPTSISTDSFLLTPAPSIAEAKGKTYTLAARVRLSAPLTGSLNSVAALRAMIVQINGGATALSDPVPNQAGVYEVRVTATISPGATYSSFRIYNGASFGGGSVWVDQLTVVQVPSLAEPYTGPLFDGNTQNGDGQIYLWDGETNASTSSRQYTPVDPCSFCAEFIISYIPPNTEMTIDGTTERAFASVDGGASQSVSNLLYGTGGVPMTWPVLTCGIPYVISVDTPLDENAALAVSLGLSRRV